MKYGQRRDGESICPKTVQDIHETSKDAHEAMGILLGLTQA